jgi:tetratricopeptide (TPR) repeat protein
VANVSVEELVRQGSAAMRVGDIDAARSYFEQAIGVDESHIPAWLGLAGAVKSLDEKARCFQRVLDIDPAHPEALAGLEWISKSRPAGEADASATAGETETLYCANHPNTETLLRCNRCGKPICTRCAMRTPVGYRCKECVAGLQANYYTGRAYDYPIAGLAAFLLSLIAGAIVPWLGGLIPFYGWIAMIFAAPAVAGLIAEIIRRSVAKRRSRYLWLAICVSAAFGSLAGAGLMWAIGLPSSILTFGIYGVLLISTLYARTR